MAKKISFGKTIVYVELGNDLYKIGSIPLSVWEEFESMGEENTFENILNGSELNYAKIARDFLIVILKKHNQNLDIDKVYEQLTDLTIDQLQDFFSKAMNIDRSLIINSDDFEELTEEDKKKLKKKMIN